MKLCVIVCANGADIELEKAARINAAEAPPHPTGGEGVPGGVARGV